ncbi:MAG: homocysteine S-methyltransferase family protein, partial [Pseudomonadota bacterium]
QALIEAPQCVTQAHQAFINAGAEIITVNSYACAPFHLEEFEWQLADGASAISYSFSANGEHFLVLDSLGFLNVLEAHAILGVSYVEKSVKSNRVGGTRCC